MNKELINAIENKNVYDIKKIVQFTMYQKIGQKINELKPEIVRGLK
jgi:hypothetical protein